MQENIKEHELFLSEYEYKESKKPVEDLLEERNIYVRRLNPDKEHEIFSEEEPDLYHNGRVREGSIKDHMKAVEKGVPTVNSIEGVLTVTDRYEFQEPLEKCGFKTPEYELWSDPGDALSSDLDGPVILKTRYQLSGPNKHDLKVFNECSEVSDNWPDYAEEIIAQEYKEPEEILKVTNIGRDVSVARAQLDGTETVEVAEGRLEPYMEPKSPSNEIRSKMKKTSKELGLEIFDVDCINSAGEVFAVDINAVIKMDAVEDAAKKYADHLTRHLERVNEVHKLNEDGYVKVEI